MATEEESGGSTGRTDPAPPASVTLELDATIAADDGAAPRRGSSTADPPTKIGRHIVIEELGAGGMGVVYAAYDPELDRRLAIKVIPIRRRRGGDRATARARILREAQAMAKVSHPNVVQIFDVGVVDERDQVYIAMELIPGETLRAWLDAEARPWRTVVERFIAAGEGLAAAHDAGLIHRDFKPDNVLLDRRGRARVADFGLARASAGPPLDGDDGGIEDTTTAPGHDTVSALLRSDLTHAGALLGTPAYMSPEHFAGAELDPRSDLFSFAVSLYEALYAERPFSGESLAKLCHAVTVGMIRPPPPGRRVPPWLRRALVRALSPAPEDRQGSMRELLEQLRRGLGRRRRALQLTGVAALAAAVGLASIAVTGAARDSCDDVDEALAGVWDDGRRDALREAYAGSELPYAEATGARAIAALDAYAEAWSAASRAACEAARDGDPEGLAPLRRRCLRESLTIVDARAQLLTTADDAVIDATERLVAGLRPLAECEDADLLRSELPLPADPLERGAIDDLRRRLAAIDARLSAGQIELGLEQVAAVLRDAEATDYTPVLAEARLREAALAPKCVELAPQNRR